jgi:putative DNA primase/helicase
MTVSGGRHIIFEYPQGYELRNSAGNLLGPYIDTRGDGGYVIWAGSKTPIGDYRYRDGFSPLELGFGQIPGTLLEKLTNRQNKLSTLYSNDRTIPDGQRNNTLFMEGVTLVNYGVSDEKVKRHIELRASDCVGELNSKEIEAIKTSVNSYRDTSTIPFTDLGNGERLVRDWSGQIIYCSDQKVWYVWANTHWVMDEHRVKQFAKQTTRDIPSEPVISSEMMQKLITWQKTSEAMSRQNAMLEAACFDPKVSRPFSVFTNDLELFNLSNGTFNLKKQILCEHNRADYITQLANASLREEANCPRWLQFIEEITDNDCELASYLQRFCGYMLSGQRKEQIILFLLGSGANGKSVFLSVLKHVFGTYAGVINSKALIDRSTSSIPSDIAALANKRFVMLSEFPEHVPLNTATVKSITGGDEITARHLYKEWFEFKPQFQIVCAVNDLPKLDWVDNAYFRRVRIVPFERIFSQKNMDKRLEQKLKEEADGIINWMVRGYQDYAENGLEPTTKMEHFLAEYRSNEDPVNQFIETELIECEFGTFLPMYEIKRALNGFCLSQGFGIPSDRSVNKRLRELLGPSTQQRHGHKKERHRGYKGYQIKPPKEDDCPF